MVIEPNILFVEFILIFYNVCVLTFAREKSAKKKKEIIVVSH